jgi:hypothetical protein
LSPTKTVTSVTERKETVGDQEKTEEDSKPITSSSKHWAEHKRESNPFQKAADCFIEKQPQISTAGSFIITTTQSPRAQRTMLVVDSSPSK